MLILNKMVLDVFVEGCEDSFSCQYSGFGKFRCEILRGWNPELGRLYDRKYGFLWNKGGGGFEIGLIQMLLGKQFGQSENLQEQIDEILEQYDKPYNEGMKIFANHSDYDGEITSDECVLLLKSFGRVDPEKFDDSDEEMNEWYRESYVVWQKMMTYAIENNQSILFG